MFQDAIPAKYRKIVYLVLSIVSAVLGVLTTAGVVPGGVAAVVTQIISAFGFNLARANTNPQ